MLNGKTSPLDEPQDVIAGTTINCSKSIYCVNSQCDDLAIAFFKSAYKNTFGVINTYLTNPVKSAILQKTLNRVTKWIYNYSLSDTKNRDSATA